MGAADALTPPHARRPIADARGRRATGARVPTAQAIIIIVNLSTTAVATGARKPANAS